MKDALKVLRIAFVASFLIADSAVPTADRFRQMMEEEVYKQYRWADRSGQSKELEGVGL